MKVRIIVAQSGLYNGAPWPAPGETVDLPDHVAEGMIRNHLVEDAKGKTSDEAKAAADHAAEVQAREEAAAEQAREDAEEAAEAAAQALTETRPAPVADVETPEKPAVAAKKTAAKSAKS